MPTIAQPEVPAIRIVHESGYGTRATFHTLGEDGTYTTSANTPEPDPKPNEQPAVWDLVIADMHARDEFGRNHYGMPLQAHNGRNPEVDAYQEVLDLAAYFRQAIIERAAMTADIAALKSERDMLRVELDNASTVLDVANEVIGEVRGVCKAGAAEETALAVRRVRDDAEEMRRQRNVLAQAIADTAERAGGYNGTSPLTGPHLLLLLKDLGEEFERLRSIESSHKR